MITADKLMTMLGLQDKMNAKVNPDWLTAGYPWLRAVVVEGGEALDHWGWKWWKKQTPDLPQFRIELVDIWHFALSHELVVADGNKHAAADSILMRANAEYHKEGIMHGGWHKKYDQMNTVARIELLIGLATVGKFSYALFATLMRDADMTWDSLHLGYVAKNVLNFFRQDHGYKDGTYIKFWGGKEDNVVLEELCGLLDTSSPTFPNTLYEELKRKYAEVVERYANNPMH